MIPKQIHIIWVGDQTKRPDNCINTWIRRNPSWRVKVWGNQDLADYGWVNVAHIKQMAGREKVQQSLLVDCIGPPRRQG